MPSINRWLTVLCLFACSLQVFGQETELNLDRQTYLPNEAIVARFKNAPGNVKDWIALYASDKPPQEYISWQYLDGTEVGNVAVTDGEVTFPLGAAEPGSYLVRLLLNDGYNVVAEVPLTVAVVPRVRADAKTYQPGTKVTVQFLNGPANPKDWIGIYRPGGDSGSPLDWFYVDGTQGGATGIADGTLVFAGGFSTPGDYEVRFFSNDSFDILDTARFAVANAGPVVRLTPGDRQVVVEWDPVTQPAPVEKYQILAAPSVGGTFTQVGEATGLRFVHDGLQNGVELCYVVRAVSGTRTGPDSVIQCTAPYVLGPDEFVSFGVPPGTVGNYGFSGQLGLDFEVVNPIRVEQLGAFDDGANGLKSEIRVTLYDSVSQGVTATMTFTPAAPGVLRGGSRFKALDSAVALPRGFRGTIVASGYGPEEKAGDALKVDLGLRSQTGRDSLFFSGVSRSGPAGEFPGNPEPGTGVRYAAGTFSFLATAPTAPGKPIVTSIPGDGDVALYWQTVKAPLPAAKYRVLSSAVADGAFEPVAEVMDIAYVDSGRPNGTTIFYKVRAVGANGEEGVESEVVAVTPDAPTAGSAYVIPELTEGNQANFSGSAGNDFDVTRPVRIRKLGVFDDGSDGLKRTIKCRLYDRASRAELALLVFDAANPGELVGGSRFKSLDAPIDLPIGFQGTIVASGYGEGERDGNRGAGVITFDKFSGGCLNFVGRSRWGNDPDAFPEIIDGGPSDRYAAGNFYFEPLSEEPNVSIQEVDAETVRLKWAGVGVLNSSENVSGPWDLVLGAVSGGSYPLSSGMQFYRLRVKP
ncbi:MAG TPA: hypothetical protein PLX89_09535 [Verrucomicrobiota bacterium]|nr:hypothetical protein [Verrucomicrobiales bacterium]HRI13237.1 hypothetical protein [Verrucomicrobiota bacterium]